jgi:hypothetical protein
MVQGLIGFIRYYYQQYITSFQEAPYEGIKKLNKEVKRAEAGVVLGW